MPGRRAEELSSEQQRPQARPKVASARKLPTSLTVHVPLTLHLRCGRKTVISPVHPERNPVLQAKI